MLQTIIPPKNSLKNLMLNLLLRNGSLSVNEMKKMLKEIYKKSFSYQGINKVVKDLQEAEILLEEDRNFSINPSWVESMRETLREFPKNNISIYSKEIKELEFSSISEALTFVINNLYSGTLLNNGEKTCLVHMNNLGFWSLDKSQIERMKKLALTHRCVFILAKNNFVTKAAAQFFKKAHFEIYLGIPKSTPYITAIIGNTLLTVLSNNNIKYFSELYNKIESIEDERMLEIFESARSENKFDVKILFETNPKIVEDTKEHLLELIRDERRL